MLRGLLLAARFVVLLLAGHRQGRTRPAAGTRVQVPTAVLILFVGSAAVLSQVSVGAMCRRSCISHMCDVFRSTSPTRPGTTPGSVRNPDGSYGGATRPNVVRQLKQAMRPVCAAFQFVVAQDSCAGNNGARSHRSGKRQGMWLCLQGSRKPPQLQSALMAEGLDFALEAAGVAGTGYTGAAAAWAPCPFTFAAGCAEGAFVGLATTAGSGVSPGALAYASYRSFRERFAKRWHHRYSRYSL